MDANVWTQLGLGGVFAILIIDRFVTLVIKLREKKGNGNGSGTETVKDIKAIVIDTNNKAASIHELTNRIDGDGVPMVYTPRSIVESQKKTAEAQEQTARHLSEVVRVQKQMADDVRTIVKERG